MADHHIYPKEHVKIPNLEELLKFCFTKSVNIEPDVLKLIR